MTRPAEAELLARFAAAIADAAGGLAPRLQTAFARVPRDRFLGPGPWWFYGPGARAPVQTPDDDPIHVLSDVSVALDRDRHLYNGQPSRVARWMRSLRIPTAGRVAHIGCGTGYYTAVLAEVVGADGQVTAFEIDDDLAQRAADALAPWRQALVVHADARSGMPGDLDALLVHAGATHPLDAWLDAIRDGGRLLVPLACTIPGIPAPLAKGVSVLLHRSGSEWVAEVGEPLMIYALERLRDDALNRRLGEALMRGGTARVTRLRRDRHAVASTCWYHGPTSCLGYGPGAS